MKITTEQKVTQNIYAGEVTFTPFTATNDTELHIRVSAGTITTGATTFTINVYQDLAKADMIVYTVAAPKITDGDTAGWYYTIQVPAQPYKLRLELTLALFF